MTWNLKSSYLDFLCKIVGRTYEYSQLLTFLHGVEFYSLVHNDENRLKDGEHLRENYIDEVGPTRAPSLPNGPCTVLEMLIGLAFRLEFDLSGGEYERPAADWFWVLVDNVGLTFYDDYILKVRPEIHPEMGKIVLNLLDRRYDSDGNGGLFPLKNPRQDQKQVEIWYQMSAWIIENYPI